MARAVSLFGTTFALVVGVVVIFVLPARAQDDGGIPPGTPVTPSDFNGVSDDPRVFTVESRDCRVPEQDVAVTIRDGDGTAITYQDGDGVGITRGSNGRVNLESSDNESLVRGTGFDARTPLTAARSTGITGCTDENVTAADDQYGSNDTDDPEDVVAGTTSKKRIPNTGGPPYLAFGALLLFCMALLVGRGVLRR